MKLFITLAALLAALPTSSVVQASGPDAVVHIMRHLDVGTEPDPVLTERGRMRAEALASRFERGSLAAIFVTDYRRTRATAAPLAAKLGLTPIVYDPRAPDAMLTQVAATKGAVLIVGHSNTVPELVERLGGTRPGPIAHDQFGEIWTVLRPGGATTSFQLP